MFDGLLFDILVPILVVSDSLKEFHQIDVLSYLMDLSVMNRLLHTYFPVDLLDYVFDLLLGY